MPAEVIPGATPAAVPSPAADPSKDAKGKAPAGAANTESQWEVNEKEDWSVNEADEEPAAEGKPAPVKKEPTAPKKAADPKEQPKAADGADEKETYVVDGKDVLLTKEQAKRFVQKGIAFDKRGFEFTKMQKAVAERDQAVSQKEERISRMWESMEKDPIGVLLARFGGDSTKLRTAIEPYLAQQIREEMDDEANPQNKELRDERARREAAEARAKTFEDGEAKKARDVEVSEHKERFQAQILEGIKKGGLPNNERSMKRMADYMYAAASKPRQPGEKLNIDIGRVAETVKQEYIEDIGAIGSSLLSQAKEAREKGDDNALISLGEQAIELFGEDLMDLIRAADIARLKARRSGLAPTKILETPQSTQGDDKLKPKGQYMEWDEWQDKRKRVAEGKDSWDR